MLDRSRSMPRPSQSLWACHPTGHRIGPGPAERVCRGIDRHARQHSTGNAVGDRIRYTSQNMRSIAIKVSVTSAFTCTDQLSGEPSTGGSFTSLALRVTVYSWQSRP